ncbi:D-serine dehydratase [[Candida] railenensis]|uniref:D-serine dehydratase n=1 Tax=[Candida] railenensis TaxID=45579 RepID=A0A9P0W0J7_9ASCO|nr:D-serine dehydratase [[Candida] railenensis]
MKFPSQLTTIPNKEDLLKQYVGQKISDLPTPSFIVDRGKFKVNADKMLANSKNLKADFRAHIKTHKTVEGTLLQLGNGGTDKLVVSTLSEAWSIVPLAERGLVKDVLFSLPVVESRLSEIVEISKHFDHFRLMLDNEAQLDILNEYSSLHGLKKKWSIFIKIDMGTKRAGLVNDSEYLSKTLERAIKYKSTIEIYGFYCHAGHSYSSKSEGAAKDFLLQEIVHANCAASAALKIDPTLKLQISVGATPTAHASEILKMEEVEAQIGGKSLSGKLELHAGNYPFCDLQQVSTGCVTNDDVSISVIADVISTYPQRGDKAPGEQLINAGVIALARESGPLPGHGRIVQPKGFENWIVGRLSQEHGILVPLDGEEKTEFIPIGTRVSIIPQHSCITAASYPWYFVVEGSDLVVDIWVPHRGW